MRQHFHNIHNELIARCLRGEAMAHFELYKLYSKAMFNTSYRIVNDKEEAEDVLQDAFISAFKNLKSFKGESSFGAWLKRIVVNHSINCLKKRKLETVSMSEVGDERVDWVEEEWSEVDVAKVKKAIELLPDGYRAVFSLYLIEGYDHSEIAQILSISESTSKSQFNRSKKKIKEILKKELNYER